MAKRGGKRRDPARERFWRRAIRQQQQSGLAVPEFCRREGLKDGAFRWWRQELARRDQQLLEHRRVIGAVPHLLAQLGVGLRTALVVERRTGRP